MLCLPNIASPEHCLKTYYFKDVNVKLNHFVTGPHAKLTKPCIPLRDKSENENK